MVQMRLSQDHGGLLHSQARAEPVLFCRQQGTSCQSHSLGKGLCHPASISPHDTRVRQTSSVDSDPQHRVFCNEPKRDSNPTSLGGKIGEVLCPCLEVLGRYSGQPIDFRMFAALVPLDVIGQVEINRDLGVVKSADDKQWLFSMRTDTGSSMRQGL